MADLVTVWAISQEQNRTASKLLAALFCPVDKYAPLIEQDGGKWRAIEVPSGFHIVKIIASASTLQLIASDPLITIIRKSALTVTISDLTTAQKTKLRQLILAMGFTALQLNSVIPDLNNATVGQIFRFIANTYRLSRFDFVTNSVVFDGDLVQCESVDVVDVEVQ